MTQRVGAMTKAAGVSQMSSGQSIGYVVLRQELVQVGILQENFTIVVKVLQEVSRISKVLKVATETTHSVANLSDHPLIMTQVIKLKL